MGATKVRFPSGKIVEKMQADRVMDELKAIANKIEEQVYYLKFRWADEKEYEQFDVYSYQVKKLVNNTPGAFVKVNKHFTVDLVVEDLDCYIKFTCKGITWCVK